MQHSQAKSLFIFQAGLDNELLYELYECDYPSVLQTFQIFLDEMDANILELQQSFEAQDILSFKKTIHRIKPVFSYVGLSDLHKTFQTVEDNCNEANDLAAMVPSFTDVIQSLRESAETIEKEKVRLEIFIAKK